MERRGDAELVVHFRIFEGTGVFQSIVSSNEISIPELFLFSTTESRVPGREVIQV
jgi:hypothetical protein